MLETEKTANCGHGVLRPPCNTPLHLVACCLRRARSASRSKPSPKAVRGRRKTEAESQRKRWTKAKPARRLFMVRREASSAKRTRGGGLGNPGGSTSANRALDENDIRVRRACISAHP